MTDRLKEIRERHEREQKRGGDRVAFTSDLLEAHKDRGELLAMIDRMRQGERAADRRIEELEGRLKVEQSCNRCGQYHGKEPCDDTKELEHKAQAYDAMCKAGLIQFNPDAENPCYSVWGFTRWHHDHDIFKAIAAVSAALEDKN